MSKIHFVIYEIVVLLLIAGIVVMIFSLSSQDAEQSSSLSLEVTDVAVKLVKPDANLDRSDEEYSNAHNIVRQCAHATEYAVLGLMIMLVLAPLNISLWKKLLICAALCVCCASLDEWNQSFVNGRGSEFTDILTDVGGALAGCAVWLLIRKLMLLVAERGAFWRIRNE